MDSMVKISIFCKEQDSKWESQLTLPSSTTVQELKYSFFEDICEKFETTPSDFDFDYNGEILDSKKTLKQLGIQEQAELTAVPKLQGGKASSIEFANLQKKVQMKFGKAPQWRAISPGVNACSICVNPKCAAYKCEVIKMFYFAKNLNVKQMQKGLPCVMCSQTTQKFQNIIYYKTKLIVQFKKDGNQNYKTITEIARETPLSFEKTYPGSNSQYLNIFITAQKLE